MVVALLMLMIGADVACPECRETSQPTAIFSGITYGRDRLDETLEGGGLLHWVRIDLAAPGLQLYVTPLDVSAVALGWQYRLRWIADVTRREELAVVINAALFTSQSRWGVRLPGDLARGVETVVSDHVVSHVWEHTYLLWFDDDLVPHLAGTKPPRADELARAKWGIGGQAVGLKGGKLWSGLDRDRNARTAVGIDPRHKLLFLAVAESISPRLLLRRLADLGATDGMLLDGGSSSAMAIGHGATGVHPGVLLGGWRPVATFLGIKARLLH